MKKCLKDCQWHRQATGCWLNGCIRNPELTDKYIPKKRKNKKRKVKK